MVEKAGEALAVERVGGGREFDGQLGIGGGVEARGRRGAAGEEQLWGFEGGELRGEGESLVK